jgi:flavin-binding protein dodecin
MPASPDHRVVRESRLARKRHWIRGASRYQSGPASNGTSPKSGTAAKQQNRIKEGIGMSVAKVTEITASSKKGFEDAVGTGVERASKTLENVQGAWINEMSVKVRDGKISEYRVNMKVTFVLED